MAKSRTDTESVLKLVIDGKQAQSSVKELGDTYRKLNTEINNMKKSDNPQLYAEKVRNIQKVEQAWKEAREEIRGATKDTVSFKDQIADLAKNAVGNLSIAGGVFAVVNGVKTVISKNAELSDVMAGVMKTTGLSEEAVDRLNEKFKHMDTRTASTQLLELAQVAGKLGYSAEKDVLGFVSAADKIGVALGEDLGGVEEAVNSLGKLVNIFKINDQFELEESLLKVGSAINTLGASGTANEKNLIDFAQRLAGVAPAANITLPQVLALGAVMDELGQRMETSSTAIGQFLVQIGSDVPKYAKIAKMSVKDFSDLLNKDANEAFLRVLSGAKTAKGGIEGLASSMGILEVSGSGGIASLGAIADNIDLVRERLKTANKAFDEGTSVLDEFNTVNNNLAANLEKIWNKINQLWENSSFRSWLTDITGAIVDNRSEAERITYSYQQSKSAIDDLESSLNPLLDRYDQLKGKTTLNKDEQNELKEIINRIAEILPDAVTEWDKFGNALDINRVKVMNMTAAQRELLQLQNREAIESLQNTFKANKQWSELYTNQANDLQKKVQTSDSGGFLSLFGIDKKGLWKKDVAYMVDQSKLAQGEAYSAVKNLRDFGVELTKDQQSLLDYFEGVEQAAKKTKDSTDKLTGVGTATPKAKKDKEADRKKREQERLEQQAKDHFERLLKEEELFSANQLINQKAKYEKEVAQLELNYQKQIDKWEEFKQKEGALQKDKDTADEKIKALGTEKDNTIKALRLKHEEELVQSISDLREELGKKHQTELDKERDRINTHYDKLKDDYRDYDDDGKTLAKIEEERSIELANAKLRAEETLQEEIQRMRNENSLLGLSDDQKKLAQFDVQYNAELEKLREKYNAELQETELFQQAMDALNEEYRLKRDEIEKERESKKKEDMMNAAIDAAQNIANATFSIISNNIQAESNARLSEIEKQRDRELSNKNLTEKQKAAIQAKYDKQISAEKLRAWKAQKKADILSATINTALAVTKALPNWILAAAAGVAGAAQIAVIASQKPPQFERGGFIPKGSSHSQGGINLIDSRTRNFVGQIEGGEPILSRRTYANNRDIVDALLYTSQRKNGARIQLRSDLIEAEQNVRRQNISVGSPIVNVDVPSADNSELLQAIKALGKRDSSVQKVVLSTRLFEDYREKQVELENRVNG